jgi:predicted RecA/RadA family phage recombinase
MARKITDGKSVVVTAPVAVNTGDIVFDANTGWGGVAFEPAEAGEKVAVNIAQEEYELAFEIEAGTELSAGGYLYYNPSTGKINNDEVNGNLIGKTTELYSSGDNLGGVEAIEVAGRAILFPQLAAGL